jgi:hypothetical protein
MTDKTTDAVKAEAANTDRQIVFRDQKFTINPAEDWVMDFLHWTDRDKVTLALEVALGQQQYNRFRAMTPHPKLGEYMQILEQIGSTIDPNAGEA